MANKAHKHTHTQVLSNCGCVVVLGAGEGTGREQSSYRQSGSAGDRDEETALGATERDHGETDFSLHNRDVTESIFSVLVCAVFFLFSWWNKCTQSL